jgi:hypothetical protein
MKAHRNRILQLSDLKKGRLITMINLMVGVCLYQVV